MRLYEFVDSDEQVVDIVKSILLRAKAEGAKAVDTKQLVNDIGDENVTPELLVDILNRKSDAFGDIVGSATVDSVQLTSGEKKAMTSKYDQDVNKMKATAIKQATGSLKQPSISDFDMSKQQQ
jgi:hypothetical protein